jgi:hypothetical protein
VFMVRTLSLIVINTMILGVLPGNRGTPNGRGMHGRMAGVGGPMKGAIEGA